MFYLSLIYILTIVYFMIILYDRSFTTIAEAAIVAVICVLAFALERVCRR